MINRCLRCDNEWNSRSANPGYCPKCNSPYWNKKRQRASKQDVESFSNLILKSYNKIIYETNENNKGICDEAGLYNCSYRILSFEVTNPKDIVGLAITIIVEIAKKGHFFVDGNKRTAFAVAKAYLLEKDYILQIPEIDVADKFIRDITSYDSKISFKKAKSWIKKYIKKNSMSLEKYIIEVIVNKEDQNGRN